MAKYINKEEILKFPIRTHHYDRERGNAHYINGIESVMEYIEHIPTVDAVEVVRCKDCQHYFQSYGHCNKHSGRCDRHSEDPDQSISGFGFSFWVNEDDFCSYGEKRDF